MISRNSRQAHEFYFVETGRIGLFVGVSLDWHDVKWFWRAPASYGSIKHEYFNSPCLSYIPLHSDGVGSYGYPLHVGSGNVHSTKSLQ
jgi:hypothetical protein